MLWTALFIFGFRTADVLVETVRLLFVVNNRKWWAACIAAVEVTIWVWIFSTVVVQQNHWWAYISYGLGYACGQLLGCSIGHKINDQLNRKGK